MSSEPPRARTPAAAEELTTDLLASAAHPMASKKQQKKDARRAEKSAAAERRRQQQHAQAGADEQQPAAEEGPMAAGNYGDVPAEETQSKAVTGRSRTRVGDLGGAAGLVGRGVLVRGFVQSTRLVSSRIAFLVLRQGIATVQCVLVVAGGGGGGGGVSQRMVRFAADISSESYVEVQGVVSVPEKPVQATTQKVEIQVSRIYCISRATPMLPFSLEDAARSEAEQAVHVGQDTCFNARALHLRLPCCQAAFRIKAQVKKKFREFLSSKDFVEIETPKLMAGCSEGGAAVFKLEYHGQPACLAQSPQLHKQMAICGGFERVFEVGPVFRAETSRTPRHLCEFTGLDAEMEIMEHYFEVCDVIEDLFVSIFEHLNEHCKEELGIINSKRPFEPLKYLEQTLKLTYEEGIQMLKDAGTELEPMGDLTTEAERKLGQLVKEKYGTDFYILHRYPLAVRPFYTMPCPDNPAYSNSFDVFIRGQEIISGAQRIHSREMLARRAEECGINVSTISSYMESFSYGAPPHGGFGAGLERVAALFCGITNIKEMSMFPRDPNRLSP